MPKVTVIDDDADIVELIEMMLEIEGFSTTTVSDSTSALEHVRQEMPDVILLDLMMPEVDGWQVLSELKENHDTLDIPVIVVTARVDSLVDHDTDLLSHLAGHIIKPFEIDALVGSIKQALTTSDSADS